MPGQFFATSRGVDRRPQRTHRMSRPERAFSRAFGRAVLAFAGWRIDGVVPEPRRYVVCIAPHTSNWDFVIGYATKLALGLDAGWLGKNTLFRGPLDPLLRAMGGIPVDRSAKHGVVDQAAEWFGRRAELVLGIAPEGTRHRVDQWKTGFYHIARLAGVPIWPVALDWGTRAVRLGSLFTLTGDADADLHAIQDFFRMVRGRFPDQAFPPPAV
jgi:1-acyl-sn-glycerol-3-phosphate acyltransferase